MVDQHLKYIYTLKCNIHISKAYLVGKSVLLGIFIFKILYCSLKPSKVVMYFVTMCQQQYISGTARLALKTKNKKSREKIVFSVSSVILQLVRTNNDSVQSRK